MEKSYSESYAAAGVDITAGYRSVELMKQYVARTMNEHCIGGLGGFGGLFELDCTGYKHPVLISGTDGVGTKLKLAFLLDRHDTVGIDCVAMCVNDIVCCGARPLFFLDYIACGKNVPERIAAVVSGVAEGCVQAQAALIGGETAEMPGFYREDEYDLAGFGVGVVDSDKIIDGSRVSAKDVIIGIHSSGLHSNGFSLVRKVLFERAKLRVDDYVEDLGRTLAEELLTPTRIYVKSALNVLRGFEIKGVVHITGGGFIDNIPRVLPSRSSAHISRDAWEVPPVFRFIRDIGKIDDAEMYRTFNMGIGMILIVSPKDADEVMLRLRGLKESAEIIGHIESRTKGAESVVIS